MECYVVFTIFRFPEEIILGQENILLFQEHIILGQENIIFGQENIFLVQENYNNLGQENIFLAKKIFSLPEKMFYWFLRGVRGSRTLKCIHVLSLNET